MAKLPGYDSSIKMDTSPASVQRDMAVSEQTGKNIASMGKVASDMAQVWQNAEDAAQSLNRQNFLDTGHTAILDKAAKDPEYNNSEQYHSDLEELKNGSLEGFTNNEARAKFAITSNSQTNAAKIKVDGIFRTKFQDHYKADIVTSHDKNKKAYIAGDLAAKDKQLGVVANAIAVGGVSELYAANEGVKVEGWDQLRYIQMAAEGHVREALKLIDDSTMQPSEKNAAKQAILSNANQGAIIAKVEQANKEQAMFGQTDTFIDDPNKTFVEKLDYIEQQKKFGLTATDAADLTASLLSENKEMAESHSDAKALILLSVEGLKGGVNSKKKNHKDVMAYLKSVSATRKMITQKHTEGVITKEDKDGYLEDMNTILGKERGIALGKIKRDTGGPFGIGYGMDDAYKDFLREFDGVSGLADEALIELYEKSKDGKMKDGAEQAEVSRIIIKTKERLHKQVIENIYKEAGSSVKPVKVETDEALFKRHGTNMEAVESWANEHNKTVDEVLQLMRDNPKGK